MEFESMKVEEVAALGPTQIGDALLRLAQGKQKTYSTSALVHWSSHWRWWLKSCEGHGFDPFPMTEESLRAFLFDFAARGAERKTVGNYRRTLALIHQLADVPFAWKTTEEGSLWKEALLAVDRARERGELPFVNASASVPEQSAKTVLTTRSIRNSTANEYDMSAEELLWHVEAILAAVVRSITDILGSGTPRPAAEVTALAQMEMHIAHAEQPLVRLQCLRPREPTSKQRSSIASFSKVTDKIDDLENRLRLVCTLVEQLLSGGWVRKPSDIRALDSCRSSVGFALWKMHGAANPQTSAMDCFKAGAADVDTASEDAATIKSLSQRVETLEQQWARVGAVLTGPR